MRDIVFQKYWQPARVGLGVGSAVAGFLLILWSANLFAQTQLRLTDLLFVPAPTSDSIVIVALDDASHAQWGRSVTQWPRSIFENLVRVLSLSEARVIAFDVLFSEETIADTSVQNAILQARSSEARVRFVMPIIGLDTAPANMVQGAAIQFTDNLQPTTPFRNAVDYLGSVNTFGDVDNTVRRQLSFVQIEETTHLSFSLATYLAYLRLPAEASSQIVTQQPGHVQIANKLIPTDAHGLWRPYYFAPPNSPTFPVFSAIEVLAGDIAPDAFQDKIVLIGVMNRIGGSDLYRVPSSNDGQLMAGIEIHAHAIESLIQGVFPTEQSGLSQAFMIIGLAVCASMLYASLKWYWLLPVAALLVVGWLIFAIVLFSLRLEIINLLYSIFALALPVVVVLARNVAVENQQRQKAEFLLQSVVQVSHQRLVLDRILPLLAQDIQRVVGAPSGVIWLAEDSAVLTLSYQWNVSTDDLPRFEQIGTAAKSQQQLIIQATLAAYPVRWQKQLIAVIAIEKPQRRFGVRSALKLFESLAEQVAPSLESAILFTQTQQQNNLLEIILASSPAAIVVTDADLQVLKANPALGEALGQAVDRAMLIELFEAAEVSEDERYHVQQAFRTHRPFRRDLHIQKQAFTFDAAPLDSGGWVTILNNVSALAELSELKTQMLRMASHDLKKPLSRILGYGSLILDEIEKDNLSQQQLQYIMRMFQAGEEMTRIINEVLNMEQLRSHKIQRALIDIVPIVRELAERYSPDIRAKQLTLMMDIDEQLPKVFGDSYLLTQAIVNLIDNAVKYTANGGRITIRLYAHENSVRFHIEDTGYGIPEYALENIFQDFYRARTVETAHISGTGLGLGLAKSLVESQGGSIGVTSVEGIGSTFYVDLPVAVN